MRPSTTRRTLVFVVCLAGVAALYWVPTAVRTPQRLGSPADPPPPSVRSYEPSPTPTATPTTLPTASDAPPLDDDGPPPPESPADSASADPTGSPTASATSASPRAEPSRPTTTTAPPVSASVPVSPTTDPSPTATATAEVPGRVHNLHVVESDHEGLVVAWNPVRDATAYQIVLNGYPVGGTTGTAVALRWFNDDMSQHYVQVRAIGADGQRSDDAAYLPVTRPADPSPSPTEPTPAPTATSAGGEPTPSPSATR